jgi:hypothetical protein
MGLTADDQLGSSLSAEDERARKRQAIGLSARRPTAREAVYLPPETAEEGEGRMWLAVLLLVIMFLGTGWMVYEAVNPGATTRSMAQPEMALLIHDDFTAPQLTLAQAQEEGAWQLGFHDGAYQVQVEQPGHLSWTTLGLLDLSTYRLETHIVIQGIDADASTWGYGGLLVRYANESNFYLFTTNGRGAYQIQLQKDESWRILRPWTPANALHSGQEGNILAVEDDGAELRFYANGELLYTVADPRLPGGDVGLAGGTHSQGSLLARFEWIKLYALPVVASD